MYPMEMINTVRLITDTCLAIKEEDKILILAYSDEALKVASILAAEFKAAQAEVGIVIVEPPKEVEPPSFLAEAMKKVDIVITLGEVDFGHTIARKEATAQGVKYAYMPDIMSEEIAALGILPEDLMEVKERTEKLADAISRAKEVHVSSSAGTDIVLDVEGRKGLALHPIFRDPGHFAIIPFYYEVACPPVEGRAKGTVVIDGTVVGFPSLNGIVKEPIRWNVKNGKVVDIKGESTACQLRDVLSKLDENANCIAELGIGTNYKLPNRLIGTRRDNAIFGHVHLALGRNIDLGGTLQSQIHVDFLSMDVKLELDGKSIIEEGRFLD